MLQLAFNVPPDFVSMESRIHASYSDLQRAVQGFADCMQRVEDLQLVDGLPLSM